MSRRVQRIACIVQLLMVSLIALAIVPTLAFATTTPELDRLRTGLADAKADLADAEAAVDDAQADVDSIVGDPGTNAGHKEWTAYGFFKSIRDSAPEGSAAYWDAQCAMDILDGGVNTTGHSYPKNQGPAPDGYQASKWASIADNIAWDERGDAVGLDNMRVSIELLREFNDVRAKENAAEGTSLSTSIGTNCRQMAISIVQCDTSKDYSVSHTQAYEGLENLSWSGAYVVPHSWKRLTDPYVSWYEEEKVNYKEQNGLVTGHYTTIVDLNSGYFCELAGFAVCQYNASYGECRELSTFGDFFDYDTNPTPEQIYSLDEFEALFEAYYDEQVEACMFGTPDHVIEEYQSALSTAEENRTECENAVASWEQELEDYTDISTNPNVEVSFGSMTYTGAELTPKPTVKVDGVTLEEGTDYYSANYRNNVHAGTGQMQIEATNDPGTGKWHGVREASFTITPKNISGVTVTLEQSSYTYDGTAKKPGVTVKDGSKTLVEGTHYTLRYANNTNAGTANVTIEGNGDYFRTKAAFFTINRRPLADTTISIASQVYSGEALTPEPTVQFGQTKLVKGTDYTATYKNNKDAGTAQATLTGKGNYTGTATCNFDIAPKPVTVTVADASKTYGDDDPAFSAGVEGIIGADTVAYELARAEGEDAGTYEISATGEAVQGNYKVTFVPGTLTIKVKDLGAAEISAAGKPYSGQAQTPVPTVKLDGKKLTPGDDFEVRYTDNTNAGTATVTVTGKGNYTGSAKGTFEIARRQVVVTAKSLVKTYGDDDPKLTATKTGLLGSDTVDYNLTRESGEAAGTYSIKATGEQAQGNYSVVFKNGQFVINRRDCKDLEVAFEPYDNTYCGEQIKPRPIVKLGSKTLNENEDYFVSYGENISRVGYVYLSYSDNFEGTDEKTFDIAPKPVTVTVADASKTYGDDDPAFSAGVEGVIGADTVAYELSRAEGEDAGTYEISATGEAVQGNYKLTFVPGTLTINRATQTVTASNKSVAFDKTVSLGAEASGGGKLSYKSADTKIATVDANGKVTPVKVGKVSISITAGATTNYAQSEPTTVTVTIGQANLANATIAAIADQKYTGSAVKPSLTVKLGNRTLKVGTDYTVAYTNNTKVGTAHVTVTGKGNYAGSPEPAAFKIVPASLSGATVSSIAEQAYTGSAVKPSPSVKLGSTTLKKDTDYTLSYKNNIKAGTATVTVTGKGNYTGAKSVTFKIVKWAGASRIPVSATAKYTLLKGGYMRVMSGGKRATSDAYVSISGATITGKKAGKTTVYLYDKSGKQVDKKSVTVFVANGKTFEFESSVDKDYVLDIQGGSKKDGAQMIVYRRNNGKNQRYTLYLQSDGTYAIRSLNSKKWLTVESKTNKYVQQWAWKKGNNTDQRWRLTVDSANRVTFVNVKTNKCFDVQGGKTKNSAKMIVWQSNNGLNQKWKLNQK